MKRLAWFTVIVLATLAVIFILWQIRSGFWLFVFSLAVAASLRSPINNLMQRGLPLRFALLLVYSAVFSLAGLFLWMIMLPLLADLQELANDLAIGYQHVLVVWPEGNALQQAIAGRLPSSADLLGAIIGEEGFVAIQTLMGATSDFLEIGGNLIIILVLSVYWTADRARFERLWLSFVPIEYRGQAREIWQDTETHVGAYIRSGLIQSLLAGVLLGVGYWFIGLKYAIILALLNAFVWLIPIMGILLSLLVVLAVGIIDNPLVAVLATSYTLFIFFMMRRLIEPRFFDRQRFNGLLFVLVLIAFIDALGLLGLIIAPAVAIAIHVLFTNFLQERVPAVEGKTAPQLIDLQERVAKVEAMMAESQVEPSPEIVSMIKRLKQLIEEACRVSETDEAAALARVTSPLPGSAVTRVQ